ncbi:hypothetical protein [Celeribacter sp.]|uniref:hypothetical protein n=1 Tax=Celeribacter sp. TaxID=1890673 RepID=UPI003A8FFAC0
MSSPDGITPRNKREVRTTAARALLSLCPYTHIWRAAKRAVLERKLPDSARPGATIALLGLFCPFFWVALFSGASKGELIFHACHSGLVFLIGVIMMVVGLAKESDQPVRRDPSD